MLEPVYPSDEWQERYMASLAADIWTWKEAYYNSGHSIVDDQTYDLWWKNLLFLESKYPHLITYDTPTDAVGTPSRGTK